MGYLDNNGLRYFTSWIKGSFQPVLQPPPPEMHRVWFRGENLGGSFTAEQKAAVQSGLFDNLFLGDYWEIDGVKWRIVDMDYWFGCGNTAFKSHHLVIMPDTALYTARMSEENDTSGGYVNSDMRLTNLNQAKTIINSAFGVDSILTHMEMLVDEAASGAPSNTGWYKATVEIPSEIMMYGTNIFGYANTGSIPAVQTVGKSQLALFQVAPRFMITKSATGAGNDTWLRDVVSASNFAILNIFGAASATSASFNRFVRPVFAIG